MNNVRLEKVKLYVEHRLRDTNENIKRLETFNKPISFEIDKMLTGEKEVKKELERLADYIQQIERGEM